jgi:hypothetical protein
MAAARITGVSEGVPGMLLIATVEQGLTTTIELAGEWVSRPTPEAARCPLWPSSR